jgi:2-keto-4-pentenoate hydratase
MIDLKKIANDLLGAHASKKPIDEMPLLQSHLQAYEIQNMVATKLGLRVGWKIGKSSDGTSFVRAPMFKQTTLIGDSSVNRSAFNRCLVESELAIVFKNAMPKKNTPYTLDEINPNIESINAGIEICDSRLMHWPDCDATWQLADGLTHGGYILGSGITKNLNLEQIKNGSFKITIGEKNKPARVTLQNTREHPFKDPNPLFLWLVNELNFIGDQINAGDIITTGSFSGSAPVNAGELVSVEFKDIGLVELIVK